MYHFIVYTKLQRYQIEREINLYFAFKELCTYIHMCVCVCVRRIAHHLFKLQLHDVYHK